MDFSLRNLFLRPTKIEPEELVNMVNTGEVAWAESKLYTDQMPKYNPDDLIGTKGAKIYRKMMTDEQVKAVVKFKRDAITARNYYFELDDERIGESDAEMRVAIYNAMMDSVMGSFQDGLNYIMKAQWQGFSLTEKVIEVFDYQGTPYLGLKKLSPKPYETFDFYVDEHGCITKLEQYMDSKRQELDINLFVYFVQNPDMDQHFGSSELREAYRSWFSKDVIIRMYNIFMERMAGGLPVITPKDGVQLITDSKAHQSLTAIVSSIQSTTGIVLPAGFELEMHYPQSTDQFERAITMHDLQIAKALLVPNLLGISHVGQTGSFAQSQTQLEAFLWTLNADANRLEDALNEQIFDPLSEANFADGVGPKFRFKKLSEQQIFDPLSVANFADGVGPKFRFKKLSEQQNQMLIASWNALVQSGAVEASDTDERHIRELFDFPEKGEPLEINSEPKASLTPGSQTPSKNERIEETVRGTPMSLVSSAAFTVAVQRVSVAVLEKKSEDILERFTADAGEQIAEMLAGISLRILEEDLGTPSAKAQPHEVDFIAKDKMKLNRVFNKALKTGWDLGLKHSTDELAKAKRESFAVDMARIDTNATDFLNSSGFRLTGDISDAMKRSIQGTLANAVKYSWTPKQTIRRIYDRLTVTGYVSVTENANVTGRALEEVMESIGEKVHDLYRIKTGVRTNLFEAINEARYSAFTDPKLEGFVVALEYSAILDSRTTPICEHLDDRVYPIDSDVWDKYRPPNHFNCRSILVPITINDTEVVGKSRIGGNSRWSRPPTIEPASGFGGDE